MSSYRDNTRKLIRLATPIFISQLAMSGMSLADSMMSGLASVTDMAAIAISSSIYLPLILFCQGVLYAMTPTIAYLNHSNQRKLIAKQLHQGAWICLLLTMPLATLLLFSDQILQLMTMEHQMATISQRYLQIMSLGVFPTLLLVNLRCMNEGLSNTKPAMVISFIGLLLNILFNALFVFGYLGFPKLGGVGCAIATVLVQWIMLSLMVLYCAKTPTQRDLALFQRLQRPHFATLSKLFKLGLPIGFSTLAEVMLFSCTSFLLSPLGEKVVGSHAIALNTSSLFFMLPLSLGIATTVLVGGELGKKAPRNAKRLAYHSLATGLILALISALIIIALRWQIPHLFTENVETIAIASGLLLFAAIYQIPDAMQAVCSGILRGYKRTRPIFFITLIGYWGVGIPLGYTLARTDWLVAPLAAKGFWITFCVSLTLVSALLFWQMRQVQRIPEAQLLAHLDKIK